MPIGAILKITIIALLAINALGQIFSHQTWWFIQNVNLIFHEAGHFVFIFFGDFLSVLGGSLLEILIPLIVTIRFIFTRQILSAACTCWWLSTAFLSVSIYASDASEMNLPLLNENLIHDWNYLLGQLGLLNHDDLVGYIFWWGAFLSVALMLFLLWKDKDVRALLHRYTLR